MAPLIETITPENLAEAEVLASREARRFRGRSGWYGTNGLAGHLTGKLGEWAVFQWAQRLGIPTRGLFRAAAARRSADVTLAGVPIEVKSFRSEVWSRLGGCVSTYQLESILTKSALVFFCRVSATGDARTVEVVGWIDSGMVPASGLPVLDRSLRANIRVQHEDMKPVWPLVDVFSDIADGLAQAWQPPGPKDNAVAVCSKGHTTYYGHCWGCDVDTKHAPSWVIVGSEAHHRMHAGSAELVREAHGGWPPFKNATRRKRFVDVVWRHPPCWYCFGRPDELGDLNAAILEPEE